MRAALIPDQLTPLTPAQVCRAFNTAFYRLTSARPNDRTLAILMAQSALESGRWASLHCFNFTNIKASETYEGFYCLYRCNEIINGKVEWFDPPHPQCRFRAFRIVDDGALDYLAFLAQRKRYSKAWYEATVNGDPVAFVAALKAGGFFTENEEPYRKAVVSLTREYERNIPNWREILTPDDEPGPTELDDDHDLRALALAAATESRFALLEDLRRSALSEMLNDDPNDEHDPDDDGAVSDTDPAPPPESA